MCKALVAASLAIVLGFPPVAAAQSFSFAAIGDMPYRVPQQLEPYQRLIRRINDIGPAFTVHVGDTKSGSTRCDDEFYTKTLEMFNTFQQALVYTPGDNEWTDCHRPDNGGYDPLERLEKVRATFFTRPTSLGRAPISLEPQSADPKFAKFVENTRWTLNGIVFATVHIVGSSNNLQRDAAALLEYSDRNAANLAWIDSTFALASTTNAHAVVLMFQADLGWELDGREYHRAGFTDTLRTLRTNATQFRKPVLIIHGDKHRFILDKPLYSGRRLIYNATRLMVFGDTEVQGVLVTVNPDDVDIFSFKTITVPENIE